MIVLQEKNGDDIAVNEDHLIAATPGPYGLYELHFSHFHAAATENNEGTFSCYVEENVARILIQKLSSAHQKMHSGFRSFKEQGLPYLININFILAIHRRTSDEYAVFMRDYTGSKKRYISLPLPIGQAIIDSYKKTSI